MEMNQVRFFLAICEELNFTRAAKRCGVAQPSLTRAIKRLEAEFGGPLFERAVGSSKLTALGTLVRRDLAQIARSADGAKRKAELYRAEHTPSHQPNGGANAQAHIRNGRRSPGSRGRTDRAFDAIGNGVIANAG